MSQSTPGWTEIPEERTRKDVAAQIEETLDLLMEEVRPLRNVVQAFKGLLVERARFKAELQDCAPFPIKALDPLRFAQGVPLTSTAELLDTISEDFWVAAARRLLPVMAVGFPKIKAEIESVENGLFQGFLDPRPILKASLEGRHHDNAELISRLGVSAQSLVFILGQLAKPFIEKLAGTLTAQIEGLSWSKGYCPICGSMPELAFLQGEGGQRWLKCATCAFEWRYVRLTCPFCESSSHEDVEVYFVVGQEYESVEVCHKCMRYVPTIDCRNWPRPLAREVAAMALMHLDVIAQEKGFLPAAVCAWNLVQDRDIHSTPIHL